VVRGNLALLVALSARTTDHRSQAAQLAVIKGS